MKIRHFYSIYGILISMNNTQPDSLKENNIHKTLPKPFAGRQKVFIEIQQYLADPIDRHALLIIGRNSVGKTRILEQCFYVLEDGVISCPLILEPHVLKNEATWLHHVITQTHTALENRGFSVHRLPTLPDNPDSYRDWFIDEYLPEANKLIRGHRRILWLMDDVNVLIVAINETRLPEDTFDYLYHLLQSNTQSGIVMTLDEELEAQSSQLSPLIDGKLLRRLHPLTESETARLIENFGLRLEDSAQAYIHQLTDGYPLILQYMGEALQTVKHLTITKGHVDSIIDDVYKQARDHYRNIWQNSLSQNERLVLTAISGLLYDDPIGTLTTQDVENWLLETDYPLDMMTVNASIRGLEYRDLVVSSKTEGIQIRARLFQRWLIEYARMNEVNPVVAQLNAEGSGISRNMILTLLGITLIVLAIVFSLQQDTQTSASTIQPTVTLEQ